MSEILEFNNIFLREVSASDIELIFAWANDKEVRANSFSSSDITWSEHEAWFSSALNEMRAKKLYYYILVYNGANAGQVRIKLDNENNAKISFNIDKAYRGLGLGKAILSLAESIVAKERRGLTLTAEVKKSNIASQMIFKSLGFNESFEDGIFRYKKLAQSSPALKSLPTPPYMMLYF